MAFSAPASAALLLLPAIVEAKSSGAGMGGMYWAVAVLILLVVGAIGYVIYQYIKADMLARRMEREEVAGKVDAIQTYEEGKLAYFNSHFQRDLELASKKKGLSVDPDVMAACDYARAGERKKVFDLIDRGHVDVNATDNFGRSFLMVGAEIGDSRLCDGLLRRGADINLRNKFNGATVLHFAYQYEHESLGASLVARGADDSVRAIDGRTCYQLRSEDYDIEAGEVGAAVKAPAPRREMNGGNMGGKSRKNTTGQAPKGGSRRHSASGRDKMGDPVYDKMGDRLPGVPADKYRQ